MTRDKKLGYLAALGYAFIIGFAFLFSKSSLDKYGVLVQLTYRCIIAFIPMFIYGIINWKNMRFTKDRLAKLLALGIFYPLLFFGIQTYGLSITSSLEAGVAQAMAPVLTLLLASMFLQERTNMKQKASVLLSVAGVIYIIYRKQIKNPNPDFTGLSILFLATIAFSIYSVVIRKIKNEYTNSEILFVILGETALVFTVMALVNSFMTGDFQSLIKPASDPVFLQSVLYLGLLSSLASGILINFALARIEASKVIIFGNLATVIQILSAAVFLNEQIFFSHKVGSICIILGVLGTNFLGDKRIKVASKES